MNNFNKRKSYPVLLPIETNIVQKKKEEKIPLEEILFSKGMLTKANAYHISWCNQATKYFHTELEYF